MKFTAFNIELLQKSGEFLGVTSILIAFYGKKINLDDTGTLKQTWWNQRLCFFSFGQLVYEWGCWVFSKRARAVAFLWGETLNKNTNIAGSSWFFRVFLCSFHGCQQMSYLELLVILSNQIWYFPGGYTFPPIIMTKSVKTSP